MRTRTLAVLVGVVIAVGGIAGVALTTEHGSTADLSTRWVSETVTTTGGNHHAPAAGRINGQAMVYAPISGRTDSSNCALVAIDGTNGSTSWQYPIPPANCTVHSVADPTLADFDTDGTIEVLAATTERTVTAYHPVTGAVEFRANLSSYGYSRPIVADIVGDRQPEIIVVDVRGTVFVYRPNGTVVWTHQLKSYTWGQPAVADFDGDEQVELAVGAGAAQTLHLFEGNGTAVWTSPPTLGSSITWMTTGQADDDPATELVVATAQGGVVAMIDGTTGTIEWSRDLGAFAAVHAIGDGDEDGTPEVYAVANDGVLTALEATSGTIEWTTTLTTDPVQMMPPPAIGDVTGDGSPELVAVTNDGTVALVDPRSGGILSTSEREDTIYTHPVLADTDNDGAMEIYVIYGHGRVIAFDGSAGASSVSLPVGGQ